MSLGMVILDTGTGSARMCFILAREGSPAQTSIEFYRNDGTNGKDEVGIEEAFKRFVYMPTSGTERTV
jgi:hypothetical protein